VGIDYSLILIELSWKGKANETDEPLELGIMLDPTVLSMIKMLLNCWLIYACHLDPLGVITLPF
jgi:hypothetical protein